MAGVAAGYAVFTILTPLLVAAGRRFGRGRIVPQLRIYASDAAFVLVAAAAFAGQLEGALRAGLALAFMAIVAGWDGLHARRELRAVEAKGSS